MSTKNRACESIANTGSMADIAFLLLIFFMLTTTIVNDKGLTLLLPPDKQDLTKVSINERNLYKILINSHDELLVENESRESADGLRAEIKEFILNYGALPDLSEDPKKAVVSIKTNRGTSQEAFIKVLDEVKAAYYEIYATRAGLSTTEYRALHTDNPKYKKARRGIPMNISIAEPSE